jgi:hypothetical protein
MTSTAITADATTTIKDNIASSEHCRQHRIDRLVRGLRFSLPANKTVYQHCLRDDDILIQTPCCIISSSSVAEEKNDHHGIVVIVVVVQLVRPRTVSIVQN